jgi:CspA family cold shock protein
MFQVKWFNKRKGYGFVSGDLFVHHSDIQVSGYKYLKRGEYVMGEVTESGGKKKLSNIRAPMEGGKLMCEVELDDLGRQDRLEDGLVRLDRSGSAPGDVEREVGAGEVVRQVRLESAGEVGSDEVRGSAPGRSTGRPDAGRAGRGPNRARRVNA